MIGCKGNKKGGSLSRETFAGAGKRFAYQGKQHTF